MRLPILEALEDWTFRTDTVPVMDCPVAAFTDNVSDK
jgi:hypothetical protein